MRTVPETGFSNDSISLINVLFPAPVSPITAVLEPGTKSCENALNTNLSPSGYLKVRLSMLIPAGASTKI